MNLIFQDLSLSRMGKQLLSQVDLHIPGGITVILGRNGAGKTTLLRCLTGQIRDYSGSILLDGTDVRTLSPREKAKRLAYLPQELPLPHVTVEELAAFGRSPYLPLSGKLSDADARGVETALTLTGMTPFSHRLVDSLSGGERQKAFLAMVLAQETPLVVLDEPTAQLDAAARLELCKLLRTLCSETGRHFLVVMHELADALLLADRLVVLQDGSPVFTGTPSAFLEQDIPRRHFGITLTGSKDTGFAISPK